MQDATQHSDRQLDLTPKEIVMKYLPYLPWVILSVAVFLSLAYIKLRYSTPIYNVSGKLLVKDKNPYGNKGEKFSNIFMLPDDNNNLNNEIEIIKSRSMAARVIRSLGMQKQYAIKGNIRTSMVHKSDIPFDWHINKITDSISGVYELITVVNNNEFRVNEDPKLYRFNQTINLPSAEFALLTAGQNIMRPGSNQYLISWQPEESQAAGLSGSISVVRAEGASVINLSFATENTKIGLDIVNRYMKEYLQSSFEDKKMIAFNTLQFIDNQLDTVQRELGGVEGRLQGFREKNQVFNPGQQSQLFFDELSETKKGLTEQSVKLKIVDYLFSYMNDPKNAHRLVPSNLGIAEPSLVNQVTEFNHLQLQRENLLKTTQAQNPLVVTIETSIEKLRTDILENLKNVRYAQMLALNDLNAKNNEANASIRLIPAKEKQLLEVTRRQAILQELYSFLLQKKLETAISSASTVSDIIVLEPAMASSEPVAPNRTGLYTIALFLGLGLPVGIVFLLEYLNDKVKGKADITKVTAAPVLGEVGHAEEAGALVVRGNNRSFIAEQFRIIRSNLQYILPKNDKPVILVTSSFSGEGKSFVSTNLGAVLALSGKRTVILEMDIRKPKILKGLGMNERKGISNFIVSSINVSDIIHEVPDIENLYVIPCGPVPPNPAEMLLDEKVRVLFDELKKRFDAVIIDSAPVGMVSDAVTLGTHANASVYIVRHNYTLKKQIQLIDGLYREKKLPHLSIVINDITSGTGYGNYYGYGYGYGYGKMKKTNGNGYFEGNVAKKWWSFFKRNNK